jgi:hypothetical protein
MYQSPTYAGQKRKSVFVEMSERSAETARLLQQAREARAEKLPKQKRSLGRRAGSELDHLLQRMGKAMTQRRGEARG